MQKLVSVTLSPSQQFRVELDHVEPMTHEEGRKWLDAEFTRMESEPLRASGKVLLADKVLVVARDAGESLLADEAWMQEFSRAASATLGKPVVRVDLQNMTISY